MEEISYQPMQPVQTKLDGQNGEIQKDTSSHKELQCASLGTISSTESGASESMNYQSPLVDSYSIQSSSHTQQSTIYSSGLNQNEQSILDVPSITSTTSGDQGISESSTSFVSTISSSALNQSEQSILDVPSMTSTTTPTTSGDQGISESSTSFVSTVCSSTLNQSAQSILDEDVPSMTSTTTPITSGDQSISESSTSSMPSNRLRPQVFVNEEACFSTDELYAKAAIRLSEDMTLLSTNDSTSISYLTSFDSLDSDSSSSYASLEFGVNERVSEYQRGDTQALYEIAARIFLGDPLPDESARSIMTPMSLICRPITKAKILHDEDSQFSAIATKSDCSINLSHSEDRLSIGLSCSTDEQTCLVATKLSKDLSEYSAIAQGYIFDESMRKVFIGKSLSHSSLLSEMDVDESDQDSCLSITTIIIGEHIFESDNDEDEIEDP